MRAGNQRVVNSLGAPIKAIWVADAEMHCYTANNVPAGEKAGVIPTRNLDAEKSGANGLLRDLGFAAAMDPANASVGRYLRPNTYVAVLDGNPFIENALGNAASPKRTKTSAVVFGILDAEDITGGAK